MKKLLFIVLFFFLSIHVFSDAAERPVRTEDIFCRDPFILADEKTSTYYLYRTATTIHSDGRELGGVELFWSKDLTNWEGPKTVLTLSRDNWISGKIWAPEVHKYKGFYYIFCTISSDISWKGGSNCGKPYLYRGVQTFKSKSPEGPFEPIADVPCTPLDYMALDGTLYVEDGKPYMVFCHEWVQIGDGTIEMMPLTKDLSKSAGTPTVLFHATASKHFQGFTDKTTGKFNCVTDACYFFKSKTGRLFMLWSSSGTEKRVYCVAAAYSASGKLRGPWVQCESLLSSDDGGHAMIFKGFDGEQYLVYHRPNDRVQAHPCIFKFIDNGYSIAIGDQVH